MRVEVKFDVPVSALVNVASGKVEGLYGWRDSIDQRQDESAIVSVESDELVGGDVQERAQVIVDSAIWPAWEFG